MSFNIVDAIEAHVTPAEIQKIASATNEPPDKTRQAMSTGILGVLGSVMQRGSTEAGAANIFQTLKAPLFGGAENLTASFLGDHGDHVTSYIAKTTGIGSLGARGVLGTILPLCASMLGREVISRKLDAGGLFHFLGSQKKLLLGRPGIGTLASALGLRDEEAPKEVLVEKPLVKEPIIEKPVVTEPIVEKVVTKKEEILPVAAPIEKEEVVVAKPPLVDKPVAPLRAAPVPERVVTERPVIRPVETPVHTKHKRSWLPIALGLGALALGALFLGRRANHEVATAPPPAGEVMTPAEPAPAPAAAEPTSQTTVTAADMPKEEIDTLTEHFDKKGVPDRVTLSDVTFDFATANMNSGADTVDRIAELMKAHPSSKLQIEGYTDSVGSAATNAALSLERATAVQKMLEDKGIDAKRIKVMGLGERKPVASNDTEAGRAKNRRIDAVIIGR